MKLEDILKNADVVRIAGPEDKEILSVCFDSAKAIPGCLFVATKGTKADGHDYIPNAIKAGAIAVVCEQLPLNIQNAITYIIVEDSSYVLGVISGNFYRNPSRDLKLVGVTGTNGKTTIVTLLYRMFIALGYKTGLLSTIGNKIGEKDIPSAHTTPDALQINSLLKLMVDEGCEFCFMEVSSHSVVQKRIAGLHYSGGVFTNLTHDHLDFHKTFAEYIKAKKSFFDSLPADGFALTNCDDKNGMVMLQNTVAIKKSYSLKSMSDFKARIQDNSFGGLHLEMDGKEVWCRLVGSFNAYNLLAVYSVALLLGQDQQEVLSVLSNLNPAEGRFEYIQSSGGIIAVVDYAHTPDALLNVLKTINSIRPHKEKLITVFGAGGDRDKTKRPVMGEIVAELSDKVIITSDNPRSEEPQEIINEIRAGIEPQYSRKVIVIPNREEAINAACIMAEKGDIILVAGKGHEKYQEINGVKHHFDDKEVICRNLNLITDNK